MSRVSSCDGAQRRRRRRSASDLAWWGAWIVWALLLLAACQPPGYVAENEAQGFTVTTERGVWTE